MAKASLPLRLALATMVPLLVVGGLAPRPALANTDAAARFSDTARASLKEGKLRDALILLKKAAKEDPDNPQIRFDLAMLNMRLGDFQSAQLEFQAARNHGFDPGRVVPLIAWSMFYQGEHEKILKTNFDCLDNTDCRAEILAIRARSELVLRDFKAAEADSRAAVEVRPENLAATDTRAQVLAVTGDAQQAEAMVDKNLTQHPGQPNTLTLKGELRLGAGDSAGAIDVLQKAVAAAPRFLHPRISLAMALIQANRLDEADAQVQEALKIAPSALAALYTKAMLQVRRNDMAGAEETLRPIEVDVANSLRGAFLLALVKLNTNNFEAAFNYAARFHAENPDVLAGNKLFANAALALQNFDKVVALLEPLRSQIANDPEALDLLGTAYFALGRTREADETLNQAVALNPDNAPTRGRLALLHLGQMSTRQSGIRELEDLVARPGVNANLEVNLISALYGSGDYDRAIQAATAMIDRDPSRPLGYSLRGGARLAKGDEKGGRQDLEMALAKDPKFVPAVVSLANYEINNNDLAAARGRLDRLLATVPNDLQALLVRARVEDRAGNRPAMVPFLERAVEANPDSLEASSQLLAVLIATAPAKAADRAVELARTQANSPLAVDVAVRALLTLGKTEQALPILARLQRDFSGDAKIHARVGEFLRQIKHVPEAIQAFDRAIALEPEAAWFWSGRIMAEYDARGLEPALVLLRQFLQRHPDNRQMLLLEAELYERSGRLSEAIAVYRQALKVEPDSPLVARLFVAMVKNGDRGGARAMARDWLKQHPNDANTTLALADDLLATREFQAAASLYEEQRTRTPRNALVLNNLAVAYDNLNQPEALATAKAAYFLAPQMAAVIDTYGDLLVRRGDPRQGAALLKQANRDTPNDPSVTFHYARALAALHANDEARALLKPLVESRASFGEAEAAGQLYHRLGGK